MGRLAERHRNGVLVAQLPIHPGNARTVGKEDREREQNHQAREPEEKIAKSEAIAIQQVIM